MWETISKEAYFFAYNMVNYNETSYFKWVTKSKTLTFRATGTKYERREM
jgi:hypothetical protein